MCLAKNSIFLGLFLREKEHAAAPRLTHLFFVLFYKHVAPTALGMSKLQASRRDADWSSRDGRATQ
jgi:hypothetical protein